jgi:hypothetical protein
MAKVTTTVSVSFEDDAGNVRTFGVPLRERTPATAKSSFLQQTITTGADTNLNFGDVSSPSEIAVKNLDPTNYVTIKDNNDVAVAILRPDTNSDGNGGSLIISEPGSNMTSPSARANAGPCTIEVFAASI